MSARSHPVNSNPDRNNRIRSIVNDCVLRRSAGEAISDESIINDHPDLMPELGEQLQKLYLIEEAKRQADVETDADVQALRIRCPHCHNRVEVIEDISVSDVTCPSCGSRFSLATDEPQSFQAAKLESIGHFKLLDKLGVGAFGSVWSARDTELDRIVAVKIPRKGQMDAQDTEQFIREARAAAQLSHPNIVRVHEVGREGDRVYIVTDFVKGLDLADWLTDQQATPREAAELCATVADALHHAHQQGVIHRDLKPSNIMLDGDGEPHLMDFGLAKREAGEITMTVEGKLLGTPAYMPPEQARGSAHDADARSDVYSLGVILFELLTGERPFRGSTRMLLHQVLVEDAPSPRKLNSSIPKDLETICLKCLEKDPDRRYQKARNLSEDLRRFLNSEPVLARPITQTERAWRWCKRKPVVAGLSAAVVSLLLFLAVAGPIVALRERALAEREAAASQEARIARTRTEQEAERSRQLLYCSDMRTAQTDWLAGDVDGVLSLLERHYPQAGRKDLRGIEWYHLWQNCRQNVMAPTVNAGGLVRDVMFSRDGRTVLTASSSQRSSQSFVDVKQWDALTGTKMTEYAPIPVQASGFQRLSPDGKMVAVGHTGGRVTLISLSTRDVRPLSGLSAEIQSIAFSPDGQVLAAGDRDGAIKTWHITAGHEMAPVEPHNDRVYCVAFSPDGKTLASGSRGTNRMAKLSDIETGRVLMEFDHAQYGSVWSTAFSLDGKLLATGTSVGVDGNFWTIIWNVESGEAIRKFSTNDGYITAVAFSSDGTTLASASGNRRVRLWEVKTGGLQGMLNVNGDFIRSLTFSPDGTILGCPAERGNVKLWRLDGASGVSVLNGHTDNVDGLSFSPDGKTLASASEDGTVMLWDVATGTKRFQLVDHDGPVWSVAFSRKGETLASTSSDSTVKVWEVATGTLLKSLPCEHEVSRVAYSPDGQYLASGNWDGTVRMWNLANGEQIASCNAHPNEAVLSLVFSPDGELVTTCYPVFGAQTVDTDVKLWDVPSLDLKQTIPCEFSVATLVYSPDGRLLALGGHGAEVKLLDVAGYTERLSIRHGNEVRGLAFADNGRTLVSAGGQLDDVRFWDTTSGDLRFNLAAHLDGIHSFAISPDGKTLATGSADDTVKLWRAATDEEVGVMRRRWLETRQ